MYKWGYALEKPQFTNFDLQICSCKVAMLACSGYKVPTLHLQNTKLHSSNFGLQVWNDITHMYIYGATNHKYWFTNLQLHGCNVRILTPLAFHNVEISNINTAAWLLLNSFKPLPWTFFFRQLNNYTSLVIIRIQIKR